MITTRQAPAVLARAGDAWGTWGVLEGWSVASASEGAGQVCGDALLVRELGQVVPRRSATPVSREPHDLLGTWIQVLLADAAGDVTASWTDEAGRAQTFRGIALWHGAAISHRIEDQGPLAGRQVLQSVGLAAVLGQITLTNGWEHREGAAGVGPANVVNLHWLPPFNRKGGMDRSDTQVLIDGSGGLSWVHRRGHPLHRWTAAQVLDYVLKLAARGKFYPAFSGHGPTWTVSDPQNCLAYEPVDLDLNGRSVLEAINTLVNPRRGLTWRMEMQAGQPVIVVSSTALSAGTTLPAAPSPATPDLTGVAPDDVTLSVDSSATYDVIEVVGDRPWVALTGRFTAGSSGAANAYLPGWSWGADPSGGHGDGETVFRRWVLNPAWTGSQDASTTVGLRQALDVAGDGGMDGSRTYDTAEGSWQPQALSFTRDLPIGRGFQTTVADQRQLPVVVVANGSTLLDLTADDDTGACQRMSVTVETDPAGLSVGSSYEDALQLQSWLTTGAYLLATVGVREEAPLKVRWVRPEAEWPRDLPRVLSVVNPDYQQHLVLDGTVTGAAGGTLQRTSGTTTVRDDVPQMRQALELLRAYYGEPAATLSWIERGLIDHGSTLCPGRLISTATLGCGVMDIGATITRRAWTFEPLGSVGTQYTTERVVPDVEALR